MNIAYLGAAENNPNLYKIRFHRPELDELENSVTEGFLPQLL
jgi:hypothetical protein